MSPAELGGRELYWLSVTDGALLRFQNLSPDSLLLLLCPTFNAADTHEQAGVFAELRRSFLFQHPLVESLQYDPEEGLTGHLVARVRASRGAVLVVCEPDWLSHIAQNHEHMRHQVARAIDTVLDIRYLGANRAEEEDGQQRIVPILVVIVGPRYGELVSRWDEMAWRTVIYSSFDQSSLPCVPELLFCPDMWPSRIAYSPDCSVSSQSAGEEVNDSFDDEESDEDMRDCDDEPIHSGDLSEAS